MGRTLKRLVAAGFVIALVATACGGGPSSPSPAPAPANSAGVAVTSLASTSEKTSTGVLHYHVTFTLQATGQVGFTVTSLTISFANILYVGHSTHDNLAIKLTPGGSVNEQFDAFFTADSTLFTDVTVTVNYTDDRGTVGTFNSTNGKVAPPSATPTPTPAPTPTPTASYDGMYIGTISGTKTIPNFPTTTVNARLVLTVVNNQLTISMFDNTRVPTPVAITDSIPGISRMVTWAVALPPDPNNPNGNCSFHMTGTFRTGTALGKTSSGTFSYDPNCSGGGTWQANAN